jgi:DNA-binding IscR family transcriptional regulator
MGKASCDAKNPCALHHQWAAVRQAYLRMLRDATLADIVEHRAVLPCG